MLTADWDHYVDKRADTCSSHPLGSSEQRHLQWMCWLFLFNGFIYAPDWVDYAIVSRRVNPGSTFEFTHENGTTRMIHGMHGEEPRRFTFTSHTCSILDTSDQFLHFGLPILNTSDMEKHPRTTLEGNHEQTWRNGRWTEYYETGSGRVYTES